MSKDLSGNKVFNYYPWQYSSVNYLISESPKSTNIPVLGLITGGRTVNERPEEVLIEYGADVDIQSAYGSRLLNIIFPIGRPDVLTNTSNEYSKLKLGDLMNKFQKEVKTGLFKVTVEGNLSFEQDLIFSKIPSDKLNKFVMNYNKEDSESASVQAAFVLLRNEIKNGFITSELWDVLAHNYKQSKYKEQSRPRH